MTSLSPSVQIKYSLLQTFSLYLPSHHCLLLVQNKLKASLFEDEGARGTQNAALESQISRVAAELGEYHGEI